MSNMLKDAADSMGAIVEVIDGMEILRAERINYIDSRKLSELLGLRHKKLMDTVRSREKVKHGILETMTRAPREVPWYLDKRYASIEKKYSNSKGQMYSYLLVPELLAYDVVVHSRTEKAELISHRLFEVFYQMKEIIESKIANVLEIEKMIHQPKRPDQYRAMVHLLRSSKDRAIVRMKTILKNVKIIKKYEKEYKCAGNKVERFYYLERLVTINLQCYWACVDIELALEDGLVLDKDNEQNIWEDVRRYYEDRRLFLSRGKSYDTRRMKLRNPNIDVFTCRKLFDDYVRTERKKKETMHKRFREKSDAYKNQVDEPQRVLRLV